MARKNKGTFFRTAIVCLLTGLFCLGFPKSAWASRDLCRPKLILDSNGKDALVYQEPNNLSRVFILPDWKPSEAKIREILSHFQRQVLQFSMVDGKPVIHERRERRIRPRTSPPLLTPEAMEIERRGDRGEWFQAEAERISAVGNVLSKLAEDFDRVYHEESEKRGGRMPNDAVKQIAWGIAVATLNETVERIRGVHPDAMVLYDQLDAERRNSDGLALVTAALSKQRELVGMIQEIEEQLQRIIEEPRSVDDATEEEITLALERAGLNRRGRPMEPSKEQMLDGVAESILLKARPIPKTLFNFVDEHEQYLKNAGLPRSRAYYEFLFYVDTVYSMGYHPTI